MQQPAGPTPSGAKRKVLDAAIRLFSDKGFRDTTVGDIEAEAGLAPRAGGFYRHFKSKEDALVEAVQVLSAEVQAQIDFQRVLPLGDTRAELLLIGRTMLDHASQNRRFRLMLRREGRATPRMRALAHAANKRGAYQEVLPWLKAKLRAKRANKVDAEALTVALFGAVFFYMLSEDVEEKPLDVDRERFLKTWATHWGAYLDAM